MKAIKWLYAQINEFFSAFFTIFFAPLSFMGDKWVGKKTGRPILLIHGYCNYSAVWVYHILRFLSEDLGPVYTVDLGYPFDSIENYAKKVEEKVKKIRSETQEKTVDLVCHSMGGLVASYYALNLAKDGEVGKVITMGTPFQGTKLARFGMGECARQMRRDAEFNKKLYSQIEENDIIQFYHIAAGFDQIVIPYTSALVEGKKERIVFDDLGHIGLLFSPVVNREITNWLKH